jgi:hypothetical protein
MVEIVGFIVAILIMGRLLQPITTRSMRDKKFQSLFEDFSSRLVEVFKAARIEPFVDSEATLLSDKTVFLDFKQELVWLRPC